jgi:hypothetical protein
MSTQSSLERGKFRRKTNKPQTSEATDERSELLKFATDTERNILEWCQEFLGRRARHRERRIWAQLRARAAA